MSHDNALLQFQAIVDAIDHTRWAEARAIARQGVFDSRRAVLAEKAKQIKPCPVLEVVHL
jgi:hypothetical protein